MIRQTFLNIFISAFLDKKARKKFLSSTEKTVTKNLSENVTSKRKVLKNQKKYM